MLSEEKKELLKKIVYKAGREELIWMSGYIAGLITEEPVADEPKVLKGKLTIAYGTETGNSKKLASGFAAKARQKGLTPKLIGLDQYRLNDLQKEDIFLTVLSTQGEGDPPLAAKKFYDHVHAHNGSLTGLRYGVLALGDTSYPLFCKAGEDVDIQLERLGAKRIAPLQKCDTDYDQDAEAWFDQLIESLGGNTPTSPATPSKKSRKQVYDGTIISSINLNDEGSAKETWHIEIAADDVDYEPGDALGIVPFNDISLVNSILERLALDPDANHNHLGKDYRVSDLLQQKLNLLHMPERVVAKYAELSGHDIPSTRMGLLDLLKIYPAAASVNPGQILQLLEPITPRLYSIASSPLAHQGEVHLTVAKDSFCINEENHTGFCSGYLSDLVEENNINFYIHKNRNFRLPSDDVDVIMIGPGTGVAPFRSFLAEREAKGASGRNWLFFGEQHFVTDFLYQTDFQSWFSSGVLTRIDLAFSRDQSEKIYVQHRLFERREELMKWMDGGAKIYICGSRSPMSEDVLVTLKAIVAAHYSFDEGQATEWLDQARENGRIVLDVY